MTKFLMESMVTIVYGVGALCGLVMFFGFLGWLQSELAGIVDVVVVFKWFLVVIILGLFARLIIINR